MVSYHIQGRIYPSDEIIDLWIDDGVFTFEEQSKAETIGTEGMYLFPGLVDAHCHLTLDLQDYSRKLSNEEIHQRKDEHLDAGELLVRDMGGMSNQLHESLDHHHAVQIQAAGKFIAPPDGHDPAHESVEKHEMIDVAQHQLDLGYEWIKITGDWGKTQDDGTAKTWVNWTEDELSELVKYVHNKGARVAMHTQLTESSQIAIDVGVDTIEHGNAMTIDMLEMMGKNNTHWTPTTYIFKSTGQKTPDSAYIKESIAQTRKLLVQAEQIGVPILAGTDLFRGGNVYNEIMTLHEYGLSPKNALESGTIRPYQYFGIPGIEEGALASLIGFSQNPLDGEKSLSLLGKPDLILT